MVAAAQAGHKGQPPPPSTDLRGISDTANKYLEGECERGGGNGYFTHGKLKIQQERERERI